MGKTPLPFTHVDTLNVDTWWLLAHYFRSDHNKNEFLTSFNVAIFVPKRKIFQLYEKPLQIKRGES